jgi:hypothetical protein
LKVISDEDLDKHIKELEATSRPHVITTHPGYTSASAKSPQIRKSIQGIALHAESGHGQTVDKSHAVENTVGLLNLRIVLCGWQYLRSIFT